MPNVRFHDSEVGETQQQWWKLWSALTGARQLIMKPTVLSIPAGAGRPALQYPEPSPVCSAAVSTLLCILNMTAAAAPDYWIPQISTANIISAAQTSSNQPAVQRT